jgi:drug/metabolite transporter superfamily protein YnfA
MILPPRLIFLRRAAWLLSFALVCVAGRVCAADSGVAIVCSLSGSAQLVVPSGEKKAVQLFDWLQAGTIIQVAARSKITMTYLDGRRYVLAEGTKATIAADGPEAAAGNVSRIDSVPALPRLAALVNTAGTRPAATAVRGWPARIRNLYPFAESVALPEETVLRFTPVEDAARYRVELEDDTGRTILDAETQSATLTIPAGILRAGVRYHWRVTTVERMGPALRAESEFTTLPEEDIRRRAVLRTALIKMGDADSLALLADVDLRLGLLSQAREEFQAVLAKAPADAALQKASTELEKQLARDADQ